MCYHILMVKKQLKQDLKKAVESLGYQSGDIVVSISPNVLFGDYTANIALQLAKQKDGGGKQSPLEIAKEILQKFDHPDYLEKAEVAGPGFINFFIKPEITSQQVKEILEEGENFGKNENGKGKKIQVEFISANPTGPLTLANGRGGALGDTLANVLSFSGYEVEREYYVNDTGNQIRLLGESVLAAEGKIEKKEEYYQGEYIKELASEFSDKLNLEPQQLGHLLADYLLEKEIKPAINRMDVHFDQFYSERSVYHRGLIDQVKIQLKARSLAYEKDGALWFKSSQFGDEKDRVLLTSEEGRGKTEPTYFLADIAHHLDDLEKGYIKRINILGADHHDYAKRIEWAMEALGFKDKIEIILMQMVRLFKEGQEVRMSKRAGTFVTLDELLDLVGKDVARFFFLMYSPDSQIDFNLDLARKQSHKNPVFYVQYAHARMSNILAKAGDSREKEEPGDYSLLKQPSETALISHLVAFPDLVQETTQSYQVHKFTSYTTALADFFHKFYENCQVLGAQPPRLEQARLGLVKAAKITLANSLNLMGVSAPERM